MDNVPMYVCSEYNNEFDVTLPAVPYQKSNGLWPCVYSVVSWLQVEGPHRGRASGVFRH